MGHIDLCVIARPLLPKRQLQPEDRHVPGVYSVMVDGGLDSGQMASAALDLFHTKCGIEMLDDFDFFVFDPRTGFVLVQSEDESYANTNHASDLQRIGDRIPTIFHVTVSARLNGVSVTNTSACLLVGGTKTNAGKRAIERLWDERLNTAGCTAHVDVERA